MPNDTVFDPTDTGTLRPNERAIRKAGTCFKPMEIDERAPVITLLEGISPNDSYSLFKLYFTLDIINTII